MKHFSRLFFISMTLCFGCTQVTSTETSKEASPPEVRALPPAETVELIQSVSTASGGKISRVIDFQFATSDLTASNSHGGTGGLESERWRYLFAPNYLQYVHKNAKSMDYSTLLAEDHLLPLSYSNMVFQTEERNPNNRNQLFAQYQVSSESASLYWNDYGHEQGKTTRGAIVIEYVIPIPGAYSLQGPIAVLSNHQKTVEGAILTIGTSQNEGKRSTFTPRLIHTFGKEVLEGEARQVKSLSNEESLQNMELSAGDKIVFILGSPRRNHNGMTVIDRDVRIVSKALPTATSLDDKSFMMSKLDFTSPALQATKKALDAGKVDEAFNAYKAVLARRVMKLPAVEKIEYWFYRSATADDLLEGVLTTAHYGAKGSTTYTIGKPGAVDWFKVPEDGYKTVVRDITTMHWTKKLAEAYANTGDKRYLDAYLAYWCDFTTNWYSLYHEKMLDPQFIDIIPKKSISWTLNSRLYIACRIEALEQGLQLILRRAQTHHSLSDINNDQLAMVLKHLYTREFPAGMRFLEGGGGVPNQQAHLAKGMFFCGLFLHDMKGADAWKRASLHSTLEGGGYLPDGTDVEQSFNYNKALPLVMEGYIDSATALLPSNEKPAYLAELQKRSKYRNYFMHSIVMPMSGQPICGNNNNWRDKGERKYMPGIDSPLPLTQVIKNRFYGENNLPEPDFRSIYFPYGGYVALRSDWSSDALYAFMKVSRPGRGHMQNENNGVAFSAFGRKLLVNSSHNPYSPDGTWKGYGHSSLSYNTIAVDGYGQDGTGFAAPDTYTTPLKNRFLDGKAFSFAEGVYDRSYGGYNCIDPAKEKSVITDVRHRRQLLLLREQNIMIVTDIVESEADHRFTQTWNFPPDFKQDEISAADGVISATGPGDVNLAMYQFMDGPLEYEKFYGLKENERILGWVALADEASGLPMSPAVDLHCSWRSKGQKVLVTVIVPFKTANPVQSVKQLTQGKAKGVILTLADGKTVQYLYGGEAEAWLKTDRAELTLLPGGGFEQDKNGKRTDIIIPETFNWIETPAGEFPHYK
jgi:hypothetical protein